MRWCLSAPGSAEYILPVTLSTSITPISPYSRRRSLKRYLIERVWDALVDVDRVNSEIHLEARIERGWRCTWRPWSCEPAGRDWANLDMHLETEIEWTQRCTWRPGLREFGDELEGHDRANLQAVIEHVWRYTWRLWLSEIGGVLGGGRFGGRRDGSWDSIHWLTCNCGNVESWVLRREMRNWLGAGDCRSWDDAVLGVCCTLC